jgi:bifunctional DNA-binding transcriptional regulator/antitoxin component of YhaV-PrlF toxin-antitoxin module
MTSATTTTIQMDASGRLVLPRALRERLNLAGGARLRASVVAGRVELQPVEDEEQPKVRRVNGMLVLAPTGKRVDAAAAIRAERDDSEARGLRR